MTDTPTITIDGRSCERAEVQDELVAQDKMMKGRNRDPVVVGVSGASSSGKTTLAIILAEVFTTASMNPPISLGTPSTPILSPSSTKSKGNILIHQDLFFFHKGAAETTTFPSRPSDRDFLVKSITEGDGVGEYSYSADGRGGWNVSGPDTDEISAINMWGLLKALVEVKREGVVPRIEALEWMDEDTQLGREFGMSLRVRVTQDQTDFVKRTHFKAIERGKKRVTEWLQKTTQKDETLRFLEGISDESPYPSAIIPQLFFVEGFLLYNRPESANLETNINTTAINNNGTEGPKGNKYEALAKFKEDALANRLLAHLSKKLFKDKHALTTLELDFIQEHHHQAQMRAFKALAPLMDIKLFLPTSKETARKRRMGRPEYMDLPKGTRRPGEMWKTEGYFEHVAWRNHVVAHKWLVDWRGAPLGKNERVDEADGVLVREKVDANVEETVQWAVERILEQLELMDKGSNWQ